MMNCLELITLKNVTLGLFLTKIVNVSQKA